MQRFSNGYLHLTEVKGSRQISAAIIPKLWQYLESRLIQPFLTARAMNQHSEANLCQ